MTAKSCCPRGHAGSLGPYELCGRIGAGGMGSVYLARDARQAGAHRSVAVKIIHSHLLTEPEYLDMFFDEADIASRIQHPHVVTVFDYGRVGETPYLAMEYLQGESLGGIFKALAMPGGGAPSDAAFAARVVADTCDGLHAAHQLCDARGVALEVVHRDVSPQNVFITYDGIAKVLDFGTVRAEGQRHRTQTGFIKGKCAYVAPEILRSQPFDRRADVWSMGVVLWELLTRERLFCRSSDVATLNAVLEQEIELPSRVDRSLPTFYDEVVATALRRDPEARYPTARDFRRALERALVAHGELVDGDDMAARLDELFPEGRATHRQLLREAERSEATARRYCAAPTRTSGASEPPGSSPSLSRCTEPYVAELSVSHAPPPPRATRTLAALSIAAMALSMSCLLVVAGLEFGATASAREGVVSPVLAASTGAVGGAPPFTAPLPGAPALEPRADVEPAERTSVEPRRTARASDRSQRVERRRGRATHRRAGSEHHAWMSQVSAVGSRVPP